MQLDIKSLALFCGSQEGNTPCYVQLATDFGIRCAERGLTLYYGGARLGLMRAAAEAAMQHGGRVVGIMPQIFADSVVVADNITEMVRVNSMSERKQTMERLARFCRAAGFLWHDGRTVRDPDGRATRSA